MNGAEPVHALILENCSATSIDDDLSTYRKFMGRLDHETPFLFGAVNLP
jgi:hypothetical protein